MEKNSSAELKLKVKKINFSTINTNKNISN